jgi:hypothetical protein
MHSKGYCGFESRSLRHRVYGFSDAGESSEKPRNLRGFCMTSAENALRRTTSGALGVLNPSFLSTGRQCSAFSLYDIRHPVAGNL